ncbi:MAG TPA: DUF3455 domain-containing protein [Vicinamibacterales bacterium]|nr:DUF3455 domain-containing protein [Vicinamibacterales bacterium]
MSTRFLSMIIAAAIGLGVSTAPAAAQPGTTGASRIEVPPVPANLEVPEGNEVFLKGSATGTQNYMCMQGATGYRWQFLGPQATLYVPFANDLQQQLTTHFLSPNPVENGVARATWLGSFDSSAVWARAIANSIDPNYVQPNAIPWLLLQSVGAQDGPTGGTLLSRTTYIQRLNTVGGIAPVTGCGQPSDIGTQVLVPYTTDYFFYRASRR